MRGSRFGRIGPVAAVVMAGAFVVAPPAGAVEQAYLFRTSQPPALFAGAVNGQALLVRRQMTPPPTLDTWRVVPVPGHAIIDPMYRLVNRATGGCMELTYVGGPSDAGKQDANPVEVNPTRCTLWDASYWRFYSAGGMGPLRAPLPTIGTDGGPYQIRNVHSGKCLTVSYSRFEEGTQLRQFTCSAIATKQWVVRRFPA